MTSIIDVPMVCEKCAHVSPIRDCEPDIDGDGSMGCPLPDCGGTMREAKKT